MSYTVLARRYRSGTFDEVIGQDHVAQTLKKAIESDRIAHAYLFCGTRGVGKTSMARIMAKALNCEKSKGPTTEPCGKCESCLGIARGDDIDVIEIDAASNTGVDNVRDLISNAQYRPARSRFKVYIIDEVHMLSKSAFNALLKILEEPPSHVKFILATTEAEKVLPTILSRCQRYDFRNIATKEIAEHLAEVCKGEKIKADEDALLLIAKAGAGSMRDALSLLDRLLSVGEKKLTAEMIEQLLGLPKSQVIFDLVQSIGEGKTKQVLETSDKLIQGGLSPESLVAALIDHLRDILILSTCGPESRLVEVPGVAIADLQKQAQQFDPVALTQDIPILEDLRRNLRSAQAGRALLDATLVRLALADQFASIGELLGRVDDATTSAPFAQKKKSEQPVAVIPPPAADPGVVITVDEDGSDDDLPQPGRVWEGPSLAEALKQQSAMSRQSEPAREPTNIEPVSGDLASKWNALLQRLQGNHGIYGVLSQATLVGLDGDNNAVISLSSRLETFVKGFERNGKKELVRAAVVESFGEGVGYRFQIEAGADTAVATAPEPPAVARERAAAPRPVMRSVEPAPEPTVPSAPSIRITPELEQSLMDQDPLIKAAVEQLGAKIVKVTDEQEQPPMFDALKNLGNLGDIMKKARLMQDQMKRMQEELAQKQLTADAGGGMVTATVNGRMELLKLKIDKSRIDVNDTEMLEDLIVAAVHAAQTKAAEMMKEEMQKAAQEMGLPPGMLGG